MRTYAVSDFLYGNEIKSLRKKMGLTQGDFAKLVNVSQKTIERWERSDSKITGPIVTLAKVLTRELDIAQKLEIPKKQYPLRLFYMCGNEICTVIDVDERKQKVAIFNYTDDYLMCAFGKEKQPDYDAYEAFLESRCFPRTRDKMKLILKELDLPFYEPLMIIEKTEGRMAEDHFWIRIER